ncbi:hypothetical protein [Hydrogenovibrio kuenenii]|uniref:hypothetical protein n=1 Tax=Hydrogenovibrio kuenenii TaxID=63658 RepID=UPI0004672524|nr:hypothetical protein [Hydrogenovibrio kuenenii]
MSSHNAALYEVYYQDLPDSEVEKDIVFSIEEAQEAVLNFYNDCIKKYLADVVEPLISYGEVALLQNQYARQLKGKAWFVAVQDHAASGESERQDASSESASSAESFVPSSAQAAYALADDVSPNFFTALTQNLKENLMKKRVILTDSEIHQIVSDALWRDVAEASRMMQSEASLRSYAAADPDVYLILVKDDDAAVYFGTEYIDAADQANNDDLQEIINTAQMLSEKYQTQVITHHFMDMPTNWSWATVETILKSSGIMPSEKPNLLTVLHDIESLRLSINSQAEVLGFEYHQEAFDAYVNRGDASQAVFSIDVKHFSEHDQFNLTVEEVVKAVEIEPNRWICGDLLSTELMINPRKYFNTSVYNLVR